jgi:hypothetical protein
VLIGQRPQPSGPQLVISTDMGLPVLGMNTNFAVVHA